MQKGKEAAPVTAKGKSETYSRSGCKSPPEPDHAKPCMPRPRKFLDVLTISDFRCPGNALQIENKTKHSQRGCSLCQGHISLSLQTRNSVASPLSDVTSDPLGFTPGQSGTSPLALPHLQRHSGPPVGWPWASGLTLSPARASGSLRGGAKLDRDVPE